MQQFPHVYHSLAASDQDGSVSLSAESLPPIESTAPPEFGGPPGYWSPETLLTASVADCFVLTFKAIARGSRFEWSHLQCDVEGELDRVDGVTRFTAFRVNARLKVPAGTDEERAHKLLHKAESLCLITNSMDAETTLKVTLEHT
jgi:organic hydroperoxide reductase OsmC/OhrA